MSNIPFQASVVSAVTGTTDVSATNNCQTLLLGDDSNYSTNNQPATQYPLFNAYRVFTVTYFSGNIVTLSSITSPPTCPAPYPSGTLQVSMPITTGDGWYNYSLQTVPSWSLAIGYTQNVDQVYNVADGNIYTCISSNTSTALNRPGLSPSLWQLVPPVNVATSLYSKYTANGFFALTCGAAACLPNLVSNALCGSSGCDFPTFCNSPAFLNAAKAFMLMYAIQQSAATNQIQFTTNMFNLLNSICQCNP